MNAAISAVNMAANPTTSGRARIMELLADIYE
jgi:hypothetical protein